MPSCCAYSDCVCYYWWSHVNALILCIFRLCNYCVTCSFCALLMVTCKCPHFVHIQIVRLCVLLLMVTCKCPYFVHIQIVRVINWWSHVNALLLCIFRLCVLLLIVTCKCPQFCAYSDCVCYYWWSHVNALILCIFRLCVLLVMVTCKCPHFVHIQIVCVITDGHM